MYDLVLSGGKLVDPSQGLHESGYLAIEGGRIAAVGKGTAAPEAKRTFDVRGKIITAGLIDLHCHPAGDFLSFGLPADDIGIDTGVTLLCDAGSAGAGNFEVLREQLVGHTRTEVYFFVNVAGTGLTRMPEARNVSDLDLAGVRRVVEKHRDVVKGIKVRAIQSFADGPGLAAMQQVKGLATDLKVPLMVHIGETRQRLPKEKLDDFSRATVALLTAGDILSHYLTWEPGGMILRDGSVYPELQAARQRGVILDACHGLNHFSFAIVRHAIEKGLWPDVISTDMATFGWPVLQSLAVVMSKFLNLGLNVEEVVNMATFNPARALGEEEKRGTLKPGLNADITVMEIINGNFVFSDGTGRERINGSVLLEPRMVLKGGKPMPAYSAYHVPPVF